MMANAENNPVSLVGGCQDLNMETKQTDSMVTLVSCRATDDFQETYIATPYQSNIIDAKYAVMVKNVEYSHRGSKQRVLNGLNMKVGQGSIYGLTGSSGCGKTTLISCILGTRKVDAGDIFLYGCSISNPNKLKVNIPGKDIGYMPQDISLYSKFNVQEILVYFGNLYGMQSFEIKAACKNIFSLLQLAKRLTPIEVLSGGQKRRVSFAAALIHSPKLLILDEPTVGMDPLLRLRIWDHLKTLVEKQQVSVIITSHYLDEMRKADKIGIMRNGQLIAENSPQALLSITNSNSLDDVVLKLCKNADLLTCQNLIADHDEEIQIDSRDDNRKQTPYWKRLKGSVGRTWTLAGKNVNLLIRNIPLFIFVMCIPALELLVVLLMGYEPSHLPLGVVNNELYLNPTETIPGNLNLSSLQSCPEFSADSFNTCDLNLLSCRFLSHLSKQKVSLVHFNGEADAILAVDKGHIYGYLSFSNEFSERLTDRAFSLMENGTFDEETFILSQIRARFDQTDAIIYRLLLVELYKSQEDFLTTLLSSCGASKQFGEYPLQYRSPVFDKADDFSLTPYVGPSMGIPFMFFFSIISSGIRFIDERNCGMLERMLISGVQLSEILVAYMVSEFLLILVQSAMVFLLLSRWLQKMSVNWLTDAFAFLLLMTSGYTGVSLGFLLGSLCSEQIQVAIFAVAFILPNIILSGIFCPIESMPSLMQTIVHFLPCTLPAESLRSIWNRGLEFTHPSVWPGMIVALMYILILNFLTISYQKMFKAWSKNN